MSYGRDDRAFLDPISGARTGDEPAFVGRVDEALPSSATNGSWLTGQRRRRTDFDDFAEAVTPHRLYRDINVAASEEIRPETDHKWSNAALRLRNRPFAHTGIDKGRP
jgi:hypothetical protein